jgi:dTDP-4-amino-4,6-dideoxy-D-galactose acyltransferase
MSLIETLEWDSAFFGISIGQVRGSANPGDLELIVEEAEEREIECTYLLAPADDYAFLDLAHQQGFLLRDVRVQLERSVAGHPARTAGLRRGQSDDLAELSEIARESFRSTRFFADARFPRERSSALYVSWLRRGLGAEPGWIALVTRDLSGFVLCHLDPSSGTGAISLIGVASRAAGRGVGTNLVAGAGSVFEGAALTRATVVTQGHNVAAQRLYQANGYRTCGILLWLHRWKSSPAFLNTAGPH